MRLRHHRSRLVEQGSSRQRGVALLELAIVGMLLLTLLAGAFDFGMGWRATLAVNEGVRGGARVGSGVGKDMSADVTILTSLQSTLSSNGMLSRVERVVIFSAEGTGGKPSTACINGTGGTCNTFTGDEFRDVTTSSSLNSQGCVLNSTWRNWCPMARNDVQLTAQYLGVWVRARHDHMFPFFGDAVIIQRSAVMRIEP